MPAGLSPRLPVPLELPVGALDGSLYVDDLSPTVTSSTIPSLPPTARSDLGDTPTVAAAVATLSAAADDAIAFQLAAARSRERAAALARVPAHGGARAAALSARGSGRRTAGYGIEDDGVYAGNAILSEAQDSAGRARLDASLAAAVAAAATIAPVTAPQRALAAPLYASLRASAAGDSHAHNSEDSRTATADDSGAASSSVGRSSSIRGGGGGGDASRSDTFASAGPAELSAELSASITSLLSRDGALADQATARAQEMLRRLARK
jgi:hypothetical protein